MHRTTWFAIPIVGLAVLSSGLGIWSFRLHAERQALVYQTDASYSSAFHTLVSDMNVLTQRLGEAEVSSGRAGFSSCARDIWRLSFAAQSEMSKLPIELMPMHNTSAFLASLAGQSDNWASGNVDSTNPAVRKQLDSYYAKANQAQTQLESLQSRVLGGGLGWVAVNRAVHQQNGYRTGDNQVVDGFRNMDSGLSTFSEATDLGQHIEGSQSKPVVPKNGTAITPTAAMAKVARMLTVSPSGDWKTTTSTLGGRETVYMISGSVTNGNVTAEVSRVGGRVLSLNVDRKVANHRYGFANAETKAVSWLKQQGYGPTVVEIGNEFQNVGYFVMVPKTAKGLAVDSPISVSIALNNGEVLALDTQAYYSNPIPRTAPVRKYNAAQLRKRLNTQLTVEETRPVVVHNRAGQVRSGVQFIGTHQNRTYGVVLDATNGQEISVTQLS